jgi:hypothetical protein
LGLVYTSIVCQIIMKINCYNSLLHVRHKIEKRNSISKFFLTQVVLPQRVKRVLTTVGLLHNISSLLHFHIEFSSNSISLSAPAELQEKISSNLLIKRRHNFQSNVYHRHTLCLRKSKLGLLSLLHLNSQFLKF